MCVGRGIRRMEVIISEFHFVMTLYTIPAMAAPIIGMITSVDRQQHDMDSGSRGNPIIDATKFKM
jgi:hypothetical protein